MTTKYQNPGLIAQELDDAGLNQRARTVRKMERLLRKASKALKLGEDLPVIRGNGDKAYVVIYSEKDCLKFAKTLESINNFLDELN